MRILAARLLLLASAACLPLWTTGCKQHLSIAAPAPPTLPSVTSATYTAAKPIDVTKPFSVTKGYTTQDYSNDLVNYNDALSKYNTALLDKSDGSIQLDRAKFYRNNIIWGEMTAIERVYTVYHTRLFSDKNAISIASDAMTLGLTAASSIAGNPATKTILSSLGTAFAGLGLSIDKNYFSQQSFQILGLAMQTRRDKVRAAIAARLTLCDVPTYSLEQGQRDLIQYFGAGTLDSALQELQEEAASATSAASANVTNPGTAPPPTTTAPPSTCPINPPPPAAKPTFAPPAGVFSTPQPVAITSATPGSKIYYTTDGTTPTTGSTAYTTPVAVASTETIQAIATAAGYTTSALATAAYTITPIPATAPAFSPVAGTYSAPPPLSVTIFSTTPGSKIYYTTDNTPPTTSSAEYKNPVTVSSNEIIQAIANAPGYQTSVPSSAIYTISQSPAAAPTFSQMAGTYSPPLTVVISSTTPGAKIYYTTNGDPPTTSSAEYKDPVPVSSSGTIKAIAAAEGYAPSAPVSVTYTISQPPPAPR